MRKRFLKKKKSPTEHQQQKTSRPNTHGEKEEKKENLVDRRSTGEVGGVVGAAGYYVGFQNIFFRPAADFFLRSRSGLQAKRKHAVFWFN